MSIGWPSTYSSLITKNKKRLSAIIMIVIPSKIIIQKKFFLVEIVNKIEIITGTNKIESTIGYEKAIIVSNVFDSEFVSVINKIEGININAETENAVKNFFFDIFNFCDFKKLTSAPNMKSGAAI